jgi:hypothetical protein
LKLQTKQMVTVTVLENTQQRPCMELFLHACTISLGNNR